MRSDIVPGGAFPDYELPDHTQTLRRLSELQGDDPLVLTLARGHYCPKEHQQHLELAANYPKIAVAYTKVATISTDSHHTSQEFRASVGAQWPFLEDPGRIVQQDLEIQEYTDPANDPMILTLARGHYCPKEHQQHLELAANYPKIAVGYAQVATISTDEHHTSQEFRASTGAQWPFLEDPGRIVQKDLDIQEYTDPDNDPMIPHTLVLKPGLVVHKIYNGYWFWGRPSFVDLWRDLRELMSEIRPDWDLSRSGLREAWEAGDYAQFHGWDRRAAAPSGPA